jgi:spore maturation protein CgeB
MLRISSPDSAWWNRVYVKHPELHSIPYQEQIRVLNHDTYAQSDSYSYYFKKLGYECEEIVSNVTPLQRSWAYENGVTWKSNDFQVSVTLEQVVRFSPDIVFMNDPISFDGAWFEELKLRCKTLKLIVGWCAHPGSDQSILSCYDIVLSSSFPMVNQFRKAGLRAELLHHAFDPRLLTRIDPSISPTIDVSFIGRIILEKGFHNQRADLLEELSRSLHLEVYLPEGGDSFLRRVRSRLRPAAYYTTRILLRLGMNEQFIANLPGVGLAASWTEPPRVIHLSRKIKPSVYGLEMYETLARSKVTLNTHGEIASSWTGNMRLFEATGVGTCLVTDWKENLSELFSLDTEVVTYKSVHECIEKVQWLLKNSDQRKEIASAGQRRTLHDHTYANRVDELDSLFRNYLNRK